MSRWRIDRLAREARLRRRARIRSVRSALALAAARGSCAVVLARRDHPPVLVLFTPDLDDGVRATYLAVDGPWGHATRANERDLIECVVDDWSPTHAHPASETDVVAWTSSSAYVAR